MLKASHGDFAIIWDAFTCLLSKRVLKRHFLGIGLSKISKFSNFANALAMTIILFSKCLKVDVDSRIGMENPEKFSCFLDNINLIGSCKFSQSSRGNVATTVNVLTNTPNISPNTRKKIFGLNSPDHDKKHDKCAPMEIPQIFGTLLHVDCQSVF